MIVIASYIVERWYLTKAVEHRALNSFSHRVISSFLI